VSDRPHHAIIEVVGNRVLVYTPGSGSPYLIHSALLSESRRADRNSILEQVLSTSWGRRLFCGIPALAPQPAQRHKDWDNPDCVDGIELFLTDRCNLACRYCLAHGKYKVSTELPADKILHKRFGVKPKLYTLQIVLVEFGGKGER